MITTRPHHVYTPRGACALVWDDRSPEVLIEGPAGTGKSRACLEKLHMMAMLNPGMRGLMVRKTQTSLTSSGLVTWRRDVIPEAAAAGEVEFYGGSAVEPPQYRYRNGSVMVIGGMDKTTKIMSTEYDIIYVQEATELTEDDWEALTTRLRSGVVSFQQIVADCNPAQETHWLKARGDHGQTQVLRSRHEDNPLLFNDDGVVTVKGAEYLSRLDALTGVRYRRLRLGEWSSAEGVIFDEFDSAVHLIDPFEIPDGWARYWTVDFGYTNPFVCQWWAEDHDGKLYLYREHYETHRIVADHALTMLAAVVKDGEWTEPKPQAIICDHDAEGRATLERELGMGTVAAHKLVLEGIDETQSRFKDRRLFLFRDAVLRRDPELVDAARPACTAEEIPGYIWADNKAKEQPVKVDDHGVDALRYMVMHLRHGVYAEGTSRIPGAR